MTLSGAKITGGITTSQLIDSVQLLQESVPKGSTKPTAEQISPKVDYQARRAIAVFNALSSIRQEHGDEVFDRKALKILNKVVEALAVDEQLTVGLKHDEQSQDFNLKQVHKHRMHHKALVLARKPLGLLKEIWKIGSIFTGLDEFFEERKPLKLEDLLKEVQEHLGISNEDMPTIKENDELLSEYGAAGYYNSRNDVLGLATNGTFFFRAASKNYHKSLYRLVDIMPASLKHVVDTFYEEAPILKLFAAHELTHKRQLIEVQKLTIDEAKEAICEVINNLDDDTKLDVVNLFISEGTTITINDNDIDDFLVEYFMGTIPKLQESREQAIPQDEIDNSKSILAAWIGTQIYSHPSLRSTPEGMRQYIANPCEVEARMESDALLIEKDFQIIAKTERLSFRNRRRFNSALGSLKDFLVDRLINGMLLRIEEMKASNDSSEAIKNEDERLGRLYKLGGWTQTGELLFMENILRKK